jgi:uncharacterized NAD(P)/FAD-binding protein YdhS
MNPNSHVVIIGAGFSGTLLAINLLRFAGPTATLIDRHADRIARGVAYSSEHQSQLLNVRAKGMSAFPDDPDHFVRWLAAREGGEAATFVPRNLYGAYLTDCLSVERGREPGRLTLCEGAACDVVATGDGRQAVVLADGSRIVGDAVVLATGNLPPHPPAGIEPDRLPEGVYLADPWRSDPAAGLGRDDTVVLVGTGLTAVDVALELDDAGFAGQVLALSRRGLSPRRHVDDQVPAEPLHDPPLSPLSAVVGRARDRARAVGWRSAIDAFRPVTQRFWHGADVATRARFLRHLRPYWDVHRHRLAPAVADRIAAMKARGQLRFTAGKITRVDGSGVGAALSWRPRGTDRIETRQVARIVNCTGPQGDVTRSDDALLATLHTRGCVRPDALRIGLDVDPQGRVVTADGSPAAALYCLGPMTRGALWEVVAVPDLRRQCWDLARRLANAQWIGGEGL